MIISWLYPMFQCVIPRRTMQSRAEQLLAAARSLAGSMASQRNPPPACCPAVVLHTPAWVAAWFGRPRLVTLVATVRGP